MNDYTITLFLLYIKDCDGNYDFIEAKQMLGITQEQLETIITDLKQEGLIYYSDFVLKITKKGLRRLISNNQIYYKSQSESFIIEDNVTERIPLDVPYVPLNFDKKYSIAM